MPQEIVLPTAKSHVDPALLKTLKEMEPDQLEELARMLTPRLVEEYAVHIPHPVQQFALSLNTEEVLFGGAAGGGKSDYLLMAALQYVDVPKYSALILRRTWPDLNAPGAILTRMKEWMDGKQVKMRDEGRRWEFPSGAAIQFGTLQFHKDVAKYQSAEYQFIGFDELTHWGEQTYKFMFSRVRRPQINCLGCSTPLRQVRASNSQYKVYKHINPGYEQMCPGKFPDPKVILQYPEARDGVSIFDVPLRMRAATNPGGVGHMWVKKHFVDPKTRAEGAVFIPSLITDNPSLDQKSYVKNLMHMIPVDRERMLNGDWDVSEEGAMFKRHDFQFVRNVPPDEAIRDRVRFWDLAATVTDQSDWTVGALVSITKRGHWFIEDVIRFQGRPVEVETVISNTARMDGRRIKIRMEREPGSAGVNNISHYKRNVLPGYNFDGVRSTGSKEQRAVPLSIQSADHNVFCKAAQWNMDFLDEISLFPVVEHDDQVDAVCGGFDVINFGTNSRLIA